MNGIGTTTRSLAAGLALTALAAAVATGGAAAAAAAVAAPGVAASPCAATAKVQLREAGRYLVTLEVGPVPRMYTVAEARRAKPTSGVVMLEPMKALAAGGMLAKGAGRRHIRVQVCDRATGKALRSPRPVVQVAVSMLRQSFPLTLGYDVGSPPAAVRFCQVVVLPEEQLGMSVQVGGETAAFTVAP